MDSVLQMPSLNPHQAATTSQTPLVAPGQQLPPFPTHGPGTGSPHRFTSRRKSGGKKGPALLALMMAVLALAATGWFFRDQLKVAWRTHMAEQEVETPEEETTGEAEAPTGAFDPAGGEVIAPAMPANSSQGAPPPAPAVVDAGPSSASVPVAPPPMVVGPTEVALPVPPPPSAPASSEGLVEVPQVLKPDAAPGPPVNIPSGQLPPPPANLMVDVPSDSQPALEVLKKFLSAATWEDRLQVVQGAEVMKPLMQNYYASMPDGPLAVTRISLIRHDKAPQTGPPHCVFQIGGGQVKKPLPIMVEETSNGWKVDWLTFTEFKDELLARFMESYQEGPKRFHVLVRRKHYFDDDVPALDKKFCVEVQSPSPPFVGSVFVRKGTPVSLTLERHLGWEVDQAAAVVELEWRKEGNYQWVELTQLPQFNWRNADAGEVVPPPPSPAPPVALPVE